MRILIILLLASLISRHSFAQAPNKREMQAQMLEAVSELKKQIADLEKQIETAKEESPGEVKGLTDQVNMLKKQLATMESVNKSMSGMPDKAFQGAANENTGVVVPKRDVTRINSIMKRELTEAQLLLYIKTLTPKIESVFPAVEKSEALKLYNEIKAEYKSTYAVSSAANGCWMLGHWEKAIILMGRVCHDDIIDADNLNTYAAFLVMAGGEHLAMPILEYLNRMYPNNSTLQNNIGQAWFGLGDIANSKKWLNDATNIYGNHRLANNTLCAIYKSEGNTAKAIEVLKTSIKETYDPEKEQELNSLGVELKYSDLPDLNYPMKDDPMNIIALVNTLPEEYPSRIGDDEKVDNIDRYLNGVRKLREKLADESEELRNKSEAQTKEMLMDDNFRNEYLEAHNTPAHKLALRSLQLLIAERHAGSVALPIQMLGLGFTQFGRNERIKTSLEIINECEKIWQREVVEPVAALALAMQGSGHGDPNCSNVDAVTNAYLTKKAAFESKGIKLIKQMVNQNKKQITNWAKTYYYGTQDKPFDGMNSVNELTGMVVGRAEYTINRKRLRDRELDAFLSKAEQIVKRQEFTKSSCTPNAETKAHTEGEDDLAWLVSDLDCEFKKAVNTPVLTYTFTCNTKREKPKKLKKRRGDVPKGSASISNRGSQNRGSAVLYAPIHTALFIADGWKERATDRVNYAPLSAEVKDASQFSIEYDKWGNIVDIKFQLNEAGTGLADPDSLETGVESRWTWNAIAGPQKGYLNKVSIK